MVVALGMSVARCRRVAAWMRPWLQIRGSRAFGLSAVVTRMVLFAGFCVTTFGQETSVEQVKARALEEIRAEFAANRRYIHYSVRSHYTPENTSRWLELLGEDGRFADLHLDDLQPEKYDGTMQKELAGKLMEACKRLRLLAQLYLEEGPHKSDDNLRQRVMRGTVHYGDIELRRTDGWFRFHASCFGIPRIVYGIYFVFFESLNAAENVDGADTLAAETSRVLRGLMRQTFTQPKRDDVDDPYTPDQFRNHGWWVGGNFAYRPLLQAAAVCSDVRMIDVIAEVVSRSLSVVSANTLDTAFWTEGMCADGAGWGHGPQCYVWGYPTDGVLSSLALLRELRDTPWARDMPPEKLAFVANYAEGMCWYQYRGRRTLMSPGRSGMAAGPRPESAVIDRLIDAVCQFEGLPEARARELRTLKTQRQAGLVERFGTRVFWNNDDMIYRDREWSIGINMTSARTQSNEVVPGTSSTHTDFFGDGATYIVRDGLEYAWAKGAWDCSAIPGTTVRKQTLQPVKLWGGYRGAHRFAGGVSHDGDGCAAFIYQKAETDGNPRPELYGVTAHKAYFMLDGVLIALGAGIRNLNLDMQAPIRTTIDQPEWRGEIELLQAGREPTIYAHGAEVDLTLRPEAEADITLRHHGIAYTVFAAQTRAPLRLTANTRKTHWVDRHGGNRGREDLPGQVPVMQFWIDHGAQPDRDRGTDTYAYAVKKTDDTARPMRRARVVSNTTRLQALRDETGLKLAMVFYDEAASYHDGDLRIEVDHPCVIMIRRQDRDMWVSVADPLQVRDLEAISVRVNRRLHGLHARPDGAHTVVKIPLPASPYCGQSVTVKVAEDEG